MRREKYVPNGGPDGGDGGRGGHVILRGNRNYWTLLHLKYDRHVFATHGGNGSKNKSFGKAGEDTVIEVPSGTVVYNAETGEYICDTVSYTHLWRDGSSQPVCDIDPQLWGRIAEPFQYVQFYCCKCNACRRV